MSETNGRDPRHTIAPATDPAFTINGEQIRGAGGEPLTIYNPTDGSVLAAVPSADAAQVDAAVRSGAAAFPAWQALSGERRGELLNSFADTIEANYDRLLATIIAEVGTPVSLVENLHLGFPIEQMRWYARAAAEDLSVDLGPTDYGQPRTSIVYARPVGVVAAISAYNYPLHLGLWKVSAALAAGCTVTLMPSPRTPLSVLEVGRLAVEAGIPAGVLNVLAGGPDTGRALTEHPLVNKVSFTGSDHVGELILKQAAAGIKRVTLELGGKSPAIVLPGSDMAAAARYLHPRYARNAGQGCASPTRLLIHENDVDAFLDASAAVYETLTVGDPWNPQTAVGPVIRPEHQAAIETKVRGALERGAKVLLGGGRPDFDAGWWVNPHLIGGVDNSDPIAQNEIFGPVAVLLPYRDIDEAVAIANDSRFGLSSYLFGDTEQAVALAPRIRTGTVSINNATGLRPDAPFGGFGASGLGREGGRWGMDAFLEAQHVQMPLPEAR